MIFFFVTFVLLFTRAAQDADWKAEERMSASLRETDEDRPYGFIAE